MNNITNVLLDPNFKFKTSDKVVISGIRNGDPIVIPFNSSNDKLQCFGKIIRIVKPYAEIKTAWKPIEA